MRKLTMEDVMASFRGAAQVRANGDGFQLLRFSPANLAYWETETERTGQNSSFVRALCPAGIVLEFMTDSPWIHLEAVVGRGARSVARIDVWADSLFVGSIGDEEPDKIISGDITLGSEGVRRRIEVHLPHSRAVSLRALALIEGAAFEPAAARRPVLLAFGDSITQGMDCAYPSLTYAAVLARELGMELVNQAIGGWRFIAESLVERPVEDPRLIIVAFGTNDWSAGHSAAPAAGYLARVRELYPATPMAVLAPIWRDREPADVRNAAGLTKNEYARELEHIAHGIRLAPFITSAELLPPVPALLVDGIHPTSLGHVVYGQNAARAIRRAEVDPT